MAVEANAEWFKGTFEKVRAEVRKAIVGQEELVEGVLVGLAANGHVLLEGMPGLGKTLLVKSLSQSLNLDFSRIQFTPDMMPADVTGTNILAQTDAGARSFEFRRGPVFANIVLADEINRATPKTQSAMLEAMQERSVTVGGKRHDLPEPFLVMATQNPIEQEGTYPLPEAQLDRFFFKLLVPYPTKAELADVVHRTTAGEHAEPQPVASGEDVLRMRRRMALDLIDECAKYRSPKMCWITDSRSSWAPIQKARALLKLRSAIAASAPLREAPNPSSPPLRSLRS